MYVWKEAVVVTRECYSEQVNLKQDLLDVTKLRGPADDVFTKHRNVSFSCKWKC